MDDAYIPGLVLTRAIGEVICIGDDVTVSVASISGGKVRLRIVAPKTVAVDRREVRDEKRAERSSPR
jgi:carbon storage regulator